MTAASSARSQLPGRPSFRDSAMHAVAIVPLIVPPRGGEGGGGGAPPPWTTTTQSERSFRILLSSLREFAPIGLMSHQRRLSAGVGGGGGVGEAGGGIGMLERRPPGGPG